MADVESQRGRQNIVSTGRGGAGNLIRSPSRGVDADTAPGQERGREFARDHSIDRVVASGRGGAGNIRSPSRDPKQREVAEREAALQDKLIAESRGRQEGAVHSTGRGGAGNFNRSTSRNRDRDASVTRSASGTPNGKREGSVAPEFRATGRGGFGNIQEERNSLEVEKDEAARAYERQIMAEHRNGEFGKLHSSGKGGAGNMTDKAITEADLAKMTLEEREAHEKVHAHERHVVAGGRGGAGNIHLQPDGERGRGAKTGSNGSGGGGMFGSVMRSLSRAKNGSNERRKD